MTKGGHIATIAGLANLEQTFLPLAFGARIALSTGGTWYWI
jgi:hypothetical protein